MPRICAAVAFSLLVSGVAPAAVPLPDAPPLAKADFERHVMGLFSKAGCNNGSCHGSFQGKNGFRLSLFGYDAGKDYAALTRDNLGRRVNGVDPAGSLLLTKACGQAGHEGGKRFDADSWQYAVLKDWISNGAIWTPGSGTVAELKLDVPDQLLLPGGRSRQLHVTATFADGSKEEVTPFCDYRVSDDAIAAVSPLGAVTASRPGDAGLVVVYRGNVLAVRVLVPMPGSRPFADAPNASAIDREVNGKLRQLNMQPSDVAPDAMFLRRLSIDTIGVLPTPAEVRAFVADPSPDKRDRKIDELLAHPLHAAVWATKLSDITGNNTDAMEQPQQLRPRRSQMWHDWLRKRVADDVPFDQIVKGILTATSREGQGVDEWLTQLKKLDAELEKGFDHSYADRQTLDLYWRRQGQTTLEQWGEKVAAAFLGVRLECAQCHKHPTDRWTQTDYRAFANVFAQVAVGATPETAAKMRAINEERKAAVADKKNAQINTVRELYVNVPRDAAKGGRPGGKGVAVRYKTLDHPETNQPLPPRALGGPEIPLTDGDARLKLWAWLRDPANPQFARAFSNRVWGHYFGVGIVEPVDDFSLANPPSNARLLDVLTAEFIAGGYSIRTLERVVLRSAAYQRSSTPNESNKFDKNNFARAYVRPLMAEQFVDVLNSALGVDEQFGPEGKSGWKMTEAGASRFQNVNLAYVLRIFGRPPRTTACDCERALAPALPQTLYRMTDPSILAKLRDPRGRLTKLLKAESNDDKVLDELFLATLGRQPDESDRSGFRQHAEREPNRATRFGDALWALINTREFILNH